MGQEGPDCQPLLLGCACAAAHHSAGLGDTNDAVLPIASLQENLRTHGDRVSGSSSSLLLPCRRSSELISKQ